MAAYADVKIDNKCKLCHYRLSSIENCGIVADQPEGSATVFKKIFIFEQKGLRHKPASEGGDGFVRLPVECVLRWAM